MTTVHVTYTPSLNVCVSSKGKITLWTTGAPAVDTKRLSTVDLSPLKR